jgi:hypothetical protein
MFEDSSPHIWTLDSEEKLVKTEVRVGRQLGEYVEIVSPLVRSTEYVVVFDTAVKLIPSTKVSDYITSPVPEDHKEEEGDGHNHEE